MLHYIHAVIALLGEDEDLTNTLSQPHLFLVLSQGLACLSRQPGSWQIFTKSLALERVSRNLIWL